MNGPLSHIRVLDLTHARAGPTAVRLLADWGADVVKIEQPALAAKGGGVTGARRGPDEQNLHRNKRSLTLDLKEPDGLRIFQDLASQADVIVENFRAEVKHRLGVDYESIREINPAIIYASISGFGQDGPYGERAGLKQHQTDHSTTKPGKHAIQKIQQKSPRGLNQRTLATSYGKRKNRFHRWTAKNGGSNSQFCSYAGFCPGYAQSDA